MALSNVKFGWLAEAAHMAAKAVAKPTAEDSDMRTYFSTIDRSLIIYLTFTTDKLRFRFKTVT